MYAESSSAFFTSQETSTFQSARDKGSRPRVQAYRTRRV